MKLILQNQSQLFDLFHNHILGMLDIQELEHMLDIQELEHMLELEGMLESEGMLELEEMLDMLDIQGKLMVILVNLNFLIHKYIFHIQYLLLKLNEILPHTQYMNMDHRK